MVDNIAFNRSELAKAYCDSFEGKGVMNATSGLFLAGPRRVGKSTFLLEDLIPEGQNRGWLTIYVDLWSDKMTDPSLLIIEAIKSAIASRKSKLSKIAKRVKLQKISLLKTIELDFSKPGLPKNITISHLLSDLLQLCEKPILLVIDEAQHALTSELGLNAMFSIKSARDQINSSFKAPELMLVLTGSNRDKLAQLVIKKEQPFFGSEISSFPLLGKNFTDFLTRKINQALAQNNQFDEEAVWEAFQLTGHKPEILLQIMARCALNNNAGSLSDLLKHDVFIWHTQICDEFESDFNALTSLQKAVLTLLVKQKQNCSPFSDESIRYYKKVTNHSKLTVSSVQTAIQSLRDRGLIWQSSRGNYALEDESFAKWFEHTYLQGNPLTD